MIALPALVCISNCFCCLLFTPAVFIFFSFCIFIIIALYLTSLFLPFASFILSNYIFHLSAIHCVDVCLKKWMSLALRVYIWAHVRCSDWDTSLKFTEWEVEVVILDKKATECHMALTVGAANLPPASSCSNILFIYHLHGKTLNSLYLLIVLVRGQKRKKRCVVQDFNSIVQAEQPTMLLSKWTELFSAPVRKNLQSCISNKFLIPCFQMLKTCLQTSLLQVSALELLPLMLDCLQPHSTPAAWNT